MNLLGFDNIAYFETSEEREWFISNVEGVPSVTMTKLSPVTKDDIEMYPLKLEFDEEKCLKDECTVTYIYDTPF